MKKRDLRAELLLAERAAVNKKRKAVGKPPLPDEDAAKPVAAIEATKEDEESNKRRKLLQEALELDKDDDSDEESDSEKKQDKGKGKEKMDVDGEESGSEEGEDSEEEDSDDEDEEAELLRELEKIKRERLYR